MKLLIPISVLILSLSSLGVSSEKCRIELLSGQTLDAVECRALIGDSVQVMSSGQRGWIELTAIKNIHLDRSSNLVTGIGLGAIGGIIVGYVVGKKANDSGVENKTWTYSLEGGGVGLLAGAIVGVLTDKPSDYVFAEMTNDDRKELIHDLISPNQANPNHQ
jgi:hypothetical protein